MLITGGRVLQVLGLGPAEEDAYLAVLARSGVAAGLPLVPVGRLLRAGLLVPDPMRPGHYLVADPLPLLERALGVPSGRGAARAGEGLRRPRGRTGDIAPGEGRRRPESPGARGRARGGRPGVNGEPTAAAEIAPDDRELLELLASGLTDAAIGRRLGVSYRTVQRRVRTLMARLEAATRFQAGAQATRRGWL